jgi:hypothetical protein
MADTIERLSSLETSTGSQKTDLDASVAELAQLSARLASLGSEVAALKEPASRISPLEKQGERLDKSLEETRARMGEVAMTAQANASATDVLRQENRSRDERIERVRAGLGIATWTGGAAAAMLVLVSIGGYMLSDHKLQMDRGLFAERLALAEHRMVALRDERPEGLRRLQEDLAHLRLRLGDLAGRIEDLSVARIVDPLPMKSTDDSDRTEQVPIKALEVSAVRSLPHQGTSIPAAKVPLNPVADRAEPVAAPTDTWQQAQAERRFTLQLVGVHDKRSLLRFAERRRLGQESAWWQTDHQGRPWFVLFRGIYGSYAQAERAAREVVLEDANPKPWIRRLPRKGKIRMLDGLQENSG